MIITVSGLFGSGKTTVSKILSKRLELKYFCVGSLLREMAAEKGMSLLDFEKQVAEKDKKYDKKIDERQKDVAAQGDVVMDSRLGGWLIKEADLKVWLDAPPEVRAERSSGREEISKEEALKRIKGRDASDVRRYKTYYGINLNDKSVYDLVIDTSELSPEGIVDIIITKLEG
jgi:cytidylate kinase